MIGLDLIIDRSYPRDAATLCVLVSGGAPRCHEPVPADSIKILSSILYSDIRVRKTPSAVGDRQIFPVQIKIILNMF